MSETTKFVPKIKGFITLPQLKLGMNTFYYVKFMKAMELGKEIPGKATVDKETGEVVAAKKREPATVCQVLNLEDNKPYQIVCPTVFRKELEEWAKVNGTYVGKCFAFRQTKLPGKDYNLVEISEIEDPTTEASAATEASKADAPAAVTETPAADPATAKKK